MEEMQPSKYRASGDKQSAGGKGRGGGIETNNRYVPSSCQVLNQKLHTQFTHDSPSNYMIYCASDVENDIQRS